VLSHEINVGSRRLISSLPNSLLPSNLAHRKLNKLSSHAINTVGFVPAEGAGTLKVIWSKKFDP